MLNLFKKKNEGELVVFKIDGMHCTSCSMNIDGELEEMEGVLESRTSYAQAQTKVIYDPTKVNPEKLRETIESLEYKVID